MTAGEKKRKRKQKGKKEGEGKEKRDRKGKISPVDSMRSRVSKQNIQNVQDTI